MSAALLSKPALPEHLTFAWSAFWDLCGDRAIGFGFLGPIPWTAIERYARRAGIVDVDGFERFVRLVRALDTEWRKAMNEAAKKK